MRYFSYTLFRRDATDEHKDDLSSVYPAGTTISMTLTSSGPDFLYAMGIDNDPAALFRGRTVTLEAKTVRTKFATDYRRDADGESNPDCDAGTETIGSFFIGAVVLDSGGTGQEAASQRRYRGAYFGTNAQSFTEPKLANDGRTVEFEVAGCGDRDPNTREGYLKGFLPSGGLGAMGVGKPILGSVSSNVIDELLLLRDNGKVAPRVDFDLAYDIELSAPSPAGPPGATAAQSARTPIGTFVDYRFSFSRHKLRAAANRTNVSKARSCLARGGKPYVRRRGHGRRVKSSLRCRPRGSRRSRASR